MEMTRVMGRLNVANKELPRKIRLVRRLKAMLPRVWQVAK
jgi:hypothetical protein